MKAIILRGLPGSGKSTIAKLLAGDVGVIHSTDDYFMFEGEYRFDPSKLGENHQKNFEAFCTSLKHRLPLVILDNTNTQRWEYQKYVKAAKEAGYKVSVLSLEAPTLQECAERNTHGVPIKTITRMADRWEY